MADYNGVGVSPAQALMGGTASGSIWGAPNNAPTTSTASAGGFNPVPSQPAAPQSQPSTYVPGTDPTTGRVLNTGSSWTAPAPAPADLAAQNFRAGITQGPLYTYIPGTDPTTGRVLNTGASWTASAPTPASTSNLPGPIGGGTRPSTWAPDYDPSKGGFQWRDGTLHGSPEPSQGSPTLANGQPNPNYFPGGPTTDVWGNALGSANWGKANNGIVNNAAVNPFGANPFITNAGYSAPGGFTGGYNPIYFATQDTANIAAQMIPGAKVIQQNAITNAPGSQIMQNQPNWMLQLPNGQVINPGLIASFYQHGYSQPYINQLLSAEVNGGPNFLNANSLDPIYGPYTFNQAGQVGVQAPNSDGSYNSTTSFSQPYGSGQTGPSAGLAGVGNMIPQTLTQPQGSNPITAAAQSNPFGNMDPNTLAQILSLYTGVGSPQNNPFASLLSGAGNSGMNTLGNGSSLTSLAGLLSIFNALRGGNSGVLNPLFWDSGSQVGNASLYPSFY